MKQSKKNLIKVISVVGIVIIMGIVWIKYNDLKAEVYIFPESLNDYAGLTVERQIEAIKRDNLKKDICTDVYALKDGSLAMKLNKKQWNWWIDNTKEKIKKSSETILGEGGRLKISSDRKSVIFEVPSGFSQGLIVPEVLRVTVCSAEYQILTEKNQNWEIYLCFKNIDTGEIIADGTLPYDTIEFTDEDLE